MAQRSATSEYFLIFFSLSESSSAAALTTPGTGTPQAQGPALWHDSLFFGFS